MENVEAADGWSGAKESLQDQDERRVLYGALDSFSQYRRAAHFNITHRKRQNFYALPFAHQQILKAPPFELLSKFDAVDDAIDANAEIASQIYQSGLQAFGVPVEDASGSAKADCDGFATPGDVDKAKSTIRQFYREWSAEGASERDSSYGVVLNDLRRLFGTGTDAQDVKVLIPGAGLGRMVFEACRLGFDAEGNEISFHQLLASNWILNQVGRDQKFDLYPSALSFSNQRSRQSQLQRVVIPDVHPGLELERSSEGKKTHAFERMAMTAADFLLLYSDESHREIFDAVATVFFIDTAPNVIRYIETIHSTLKNSGVWVNNGPLLWHFEDKGPKQRDTGKEPMEVYPDTRSGIEEPGGFELSAEEVLGLIACLGFVIEEKDFVQGSGYIQDPNSMMQSKYTTLHFVARKVQ